MCGGECGGQSNFLAQHPIPSQTPPTLLHIAPPPTTMFHCPLQCSRKRKMKLGASTPCQGARGDDATDCPAHALGGMAAPAQTGTDRRADSHIVCVCVRACAMPCLVVLPFRHPAQARQSQARQSQSPSMCWTRVLWSRRSPLQYPLQQAKPQIITQNGAKTRFEMSFGWDPWHR